MQSPIVASRSDGGLRPNALRFSCRERAHGMTSKNHRSCARSGRLERRGRRQLYITIHRICSYSAILSFTRSMICFPSHLLPGLNLYLPQNALRDHAARIGPRRAAACGALRISTPSSIFKFIAWSVRLALERKSTGHRRSRTWRAARRHGRWHRVVAGRSATRTTPRAGPPPGRAP